MRGIESHINDPSIFVGYSSLRITSRLVSASWSAPSMKPVEPRQYLQVLVKLCQTLHLQAQTLWRSRVPRSSERAKGRARRASRIVSLWVSGFKVLARKVLLLQFGGSGFLETSSCEMQGSCLGSCSQVNKSRGVVVSLVLHCWRL